MAGILIGSLALSVDTFKSKRRQRRERRAQELERSLSEAGPSTSATMAIGDDDDHPHAEHSTDAARAKAREAYEEHETRSSSSSVLDDHELPPPYADAPEYGTHKRDTLLSSTPRRRRHSRRASAGDVAFDTRAGLPTGGRQFFATDEHGRPRERSLPREGETEAQRRKRKEREFWSLRSGAFWGLMGVALARGIATS